MRRSQLTVVDMATAFTVMGLLLFAMIYPNMSHRQTVEFNKTVSSVLLIASK